MHSSGIAYTMHWYFATLSLYIPCFSKNPSFFFIKPLTPPPPSPKIVIIECMHVYTSFTNVTYLLFIYIDYCPRRLTAIYPSTDRVVKVGITVGAIMKDPVPAGLYWVTYDFSDINQLVGYRTLEDFELDLSPERRKLPFFCEGTGHTVYKNQFFCQKMMTNKIVRYNLMESRWLGELELPGAGAHGAFPYQSDRFSDIDFATDEYGLWVVYASSASNGNIMISKIDEDNFTISETWTTLIPKRTVGNTFMICGVLYATESYTKSPTFIKYVYNTQTGGNKELQSTEIPFSNTIRNEFVSNYMLDYNPLDRKLYTWNHGRIEIYSTMSATTD